MTNVFAIILAVVVTLAVIFAAMGDPGAHS